MLDKLIAFRVYVSVFGSLIATLTIFGFIFVQCIKGRFTRESYPLFIAGFCAVHGIVHRRDCILLYVIQYITVGCCRQLG